MHFLYDLGKVKSLVRTLLLRLPLSMSIAESTRTQTANIYKNPSFLCRRQNPQSRYPWVVHRSHGFVPPLVNIKKRKRQFGTDPCPKEKTNDTIQVRSNSNFDVKYETMQLYGNNHNSQSDCWIGLICYVESPDMLSYGDQLHQYLFVVTVASFILPAVGGSHFRLQQQVIHSPHQQLLATVSIHPSTSSSKISHHGQFCHQSPHTAAVNSNNIVTSYGSIYFFAP